VFVYILYIYLYVVAVRKSRKFGRLRTTADLKNFNHYLVEFVKRMQLAAARENGRNFPKQHARNRLIIDDEDELLAV
jgi:hypothetical protein